MPALYADELLASLPTAGAAFELLLLHKWYILWQCFSALPQGGLRCSTHACSCAPPAFRARLLQVVDSEGRGGRQGRLVLHRSVAHARALPGVL
eukprot:6139212-Pyramimonas_sp.AAC.1